MHLKTIDLLIGKLYSLKALILLLYKKDIQENLKCLYK